MERNGRAARLPGMRRRLVAALTGAALVLLPAAPAVAAAEQRVTRDVLMRDSVFAPASISVRRVPGIRWTNQGRLAHTTTSNQGLWDRTLTPGQTFTRIFGSPGTFSYRCTIHRGMNGTVTVTT